MWDYLLLKTLHIISATVLFGTGLGSAFFMYKAVRSGSLEAIRVTASHVIIADWWFTTPAVVIQPLTGVLLMQRLGYGFDTPWFYTVAGLYLLAGACWVPVVAIQYRMLQIVMKNADNTMLPETFDRWFGVWIRLGIPAFCAVLILFVLMVYRPGL